MKVKKHTLLPYGEVAVFAEAHVGEVFKIHSFTPHYVDLEQEIEQSEAEMHMEHLHNILEYDVTLKEEEKAAIEYAIECIKTLDDMGIIKENNNDD